MFTLTDVLIATLFLGLVWLWWNAQGVKQSAMQATKRYCREMGVQLLDDGLALNGFWIKRDEAGSLRLWRSYGFEFTSTGNERYSGKIILLGHRVEQILLEPHRLN